MSEIQQRIAAEVKAAMKARDKKRLGALRLVMAEFKNVEINERTTLTDQRVLAVLDKMTKQRKDSLQQFQDAGRTDLSDQEALEISIIAEFLPAQLDEAELKLLVSAAIEEVGATSMQDMGKVMGILKSKVQGRADMGQVSGLVKSAIG